MNARIEDRPLTLLAGLSFYGDPFSQSAGWTEGNEIGKLWGRFMALREAAPESLPVPESPEQMFELHIPDPQTSETGQYEVFVGYPIATMESIRMNLVAKVLPATRFARFTLVGKAITDNDSCQEMYAWIAAKGLAPAADWCCNLYDSRFKSMERIEESEIDVCIPVREGDGTD